MLAGWLFSLPPQHRAASSSSNAVYHLHDRNPPQHLKSFSAPIKHRRAPPGGGKRPSIVASEVMDAKSNFREKSFAGDATFPVRKTTNTHSFSSRKKQQVDSGSGGEWWSWWMVVVHEGAIRKHGVWWDRELKRNIF
jgi:hypothetical protein